MNNEFKKVKSSVSTDTRYVLEDGGMTTSGSIATVEKPLGELQRRVEPPKPRNFVAKNAKMGGAGQHKDKKKAEKQGDAKHKKPFSESIEDRTSYQVAKVLSSKGIKYDPARENDLINTIGMVLVKELNMSPSQARSIIRSEDFLSDTMGELHHMDQSMEETAHPDEKEDTALIRKMVKRDALKKEGYGTGSYATAMGLRIQPGNGPDVNEDEDDVGQEIGMAGSELYGIAKHAKELLALIHQQGQQQGLEAWQQSKITKAADYLTAVLQSLDYDTNVEQGVAEVTGDKPFDKMMTTIKQGTGKQKTSDRKEQQKQTQQRARDAFGNMFGGGNPADKLKIREQGVAEGEVVPLGKKHRGDLGDIHSCPKCGGDLMGGNYMGQRVKVCQPCKQVYLPPNSGIDQQGNKTNEQGVAEAGGGRNRGYEHGFASPNAPSLGSRPNHGDDERHDLDDYELQKNRQEVSSYNITIDGKPINPKPIFGRSATIAWGKEQAANGVDLSNAMISPVKYTEDAYMESLNNMLERSVSQAQHNLMVGVAHNPQFAQKVKVKQKVGKEFSDADVGHDISKLPIRVPKKK